jgi:type I restriction enzyme S subunit
MSWRTVKLGELVENFSVRAKDVGGAEGLEFYGVSNEEGIIKTKYAAEDKAEDYKIIEKGCFAYNPYRVNVGSIGLVSDETKGLISPAYVIFKPKPNSIIPELLFKFLKSDEGLRQIIFYARGTVRQALRFDDLCNIEISIPDYSEQEVLYNKLINSQKSSNKLNSELRNQLDLVKKLRQSFLQEAVQGKLVVQNPDDEPASELLKKIKAEKEKLIAEKKLKKEKALPPIQAEEIPFEIPEGWVWCRLGEICSKIGSGSTPKGSNYSSQGKPFFRSQNIYDSGLVYDDIKYISDEVHRQMNGTSVFANDILLNITGGSMGRCSLVPNNFDEGNVSQHVCIIRPLNVNNNFFHNIVLSPYFQKFIFSSTTGAGREGLPKYNLEQFLIPLPPLSEQIRIVQKLDELMQTCNELEASIKESQSQNEKLLQQVLREALRK